MAHNLNFDNQGNASFFSVKEKAWHGLGTIVEHYPSSDEALKLAGLDYTVEKKKMFRNPYFLGVFCLTVPPVYSIDLLAQLTDLHSSEVYAPIFS